MTSKQSSRLAIVQNVEDRILMLRGQKVMLDSDLADLYGVSTKRLNEQVKRNRKRFPEDFMFLLTGAEANFLRSQFATLKPGRGQHRKYLPYAFTEHGAVMLATILNSARAIAASIYVVRAFVRLRSVLAVHKELARKIDALERNMKVNNEKSQANFIVIFKFIENYSRSQRQLPAAIGFQYRRR